MVCVESKTTPPSCQSTIINEIAGGEVVAAVVILSSSWSASSLYLCIDVFVFSQLFFHSFSSFLSSFLHLLLMAVHFACQINFPVNMRPIAF